MKQKKKTIIVTGILLLLLLVIGSTYAYFSIQASSNQTGANIKGKAARLGNPTLRTEVANLYLNLDANLMSQANAGKTYYANKDESGLALTTNPNYTLATASVNDADAPLDCTYNYKVTATVTKTITDGSDENVIVKIGNKTITLKELTDSGSSGVIVSGVIKNLESGVSQTISLLSSVENTANTQDSLVGNSYTINIAPYNSGDTKAFSCKLHADTIADQLIATGELWQSGLEGDGYRYIGTGATCEYENGNYSFMTAAECPTLYNYTSTRVDDGSSTDYTYSFECPENTDIYTYSCTELHSTGNNSNAVPNNFICFGTTDMNECINNLDKYMYRIIGVFPDANGDYYAKLIKYKIIGHYAWNYKYDETIRWGTSELYNGLNGSYFLTNTTYDYLQNNKWLNKIENWTWSAVKTNTYDDQINNPNYSYTSPKGIYLNEMHVSNMELLCTNNNKTAINCNGGEWTTPSGKVGLMYASDYALSLGSSALSLTTGTEANAALLKTGWMFIDNNSLISDKYEWTISRIGKTGSYLDTWSITPSGEVYYFLSGKRAVRPVFYLNNLEQISKGTGTINNPYILK